MGRKFHYNQAFSGLQLQTQSLIYWDLLRLCATVCNCVLTQTNATWSEETAE